MRFDENSTEFQVLMSKCHDIMESFSPLKNYDTSR